MKCWEIWKMALTISLICITWQCLLRDLCRIPGGIKGICDIISLLKLDIDTFTWRNGLSISLQIGTVSLRLHWKAHTVRTALNPFRKDQINTGWTHRSASTALLQLLTSLTWHSNVCPVWETQNLLPGNVPPTGKEDLLGSWSPSRFQEKECIRCSTCKCYPPELPVGKQVGFITHEGNWEFGLCPNLLGLSTKPWDGRRSNFVPLFPLPLLSAQRGPGIHESGPPQSKDLWLNPPGKYLKNDFSDMVEAISIIGHVFWCA